MIDTKERITVSPIVNGNEAYFSEIPLVLFDNCKNKIEIIAEDVNGNSTENDPTYLYVTVDSTIPNFKYVDVEPIEGGLLRITVKIEAV